MNLKRTATFGVVGAALAAWIAGASTPGRPATAAPPAFKPSAAELHGVELASEITRLRERLRPTAEPRFPARNLFRFSAAPRHAAAAPAAVPAPMPVAETAVPPAAPALPPAVILVGIAEDPGYDGPVRTAILSVAGEMLLVKVGDAVPLRFRVAAIEADAVELTDTDGGPSFRLVSK